MVSIIDHDLLQAKIQFYQIHSSDYYVDPKSCIGFHAHASAGSLSASQVFRWRRSPRPPPCPRGGRKDCQTDPSRHAAYVPFPIRAVTLTTYLALYLICRYGCLVAISRNIAANQSRTVKWLPCMTVSERSCISCRQSMYVQDLWLGFQLKRKPPHWLQNKPWCSRKWRNASSQEKSSGY